jgi:hypothetical protein
MISDGNGSKNTRWPSRKAGNTGAYPDAVNVGTRPDEATARHFQAPQSRYLTH